MCGGRGVERRVFGDNAQGQAEGEGGHDAPGDDVAPSAQRSENTDIPLVPVVLTWQFINR